MVYICEMKQLYTLSHLQNMTVTASTGYSEAHLFPATFPLDSFFMHSLQDIYKINTIGRSCLPVSSLKQLMDFKEI